MRSSRLASIDRTLVKTERPWRTSQISVAHAPAAFFCGCCSRIKVSKPWRNELFHAGDAGYVVTAEDATHRDRTGYLYRHYRRSMSPLRGAMLAMLACSGDCKQMHRSSTNLSTKTRQRPVRDLCLML